MDNNQKIFINIAKEYILKKKNNEGIPISSPFLYLNSWDSKYSDGYFQLLKLTKNHHNIFFYLLRIIKSIFSVFKIKNFKLFENTTYISSKTLIFSWCELDDFDKNGVFTDRYFGVKSSDDKSISWLLLSIDNKLPECISDNIRIIHTNTNDTQPILFYFKLAFRDLINAKFNLVNFANNFIFSNVYANKLSDFIFNNCNILEFDSFVQPFEAQPYQMLLNHRLLEKIQTIGYLHSVLPAVPTDFIYREGMPDRLYVNGVYQKKILVENLNWPENRIISIPSLRYKVSINRDFSNKIFFPYTLKNINKIISEFESILNLAEDKYFPFFQICPHPAPSNLNYQLKLKEKIENLMKKYETKFSKDRTSTCSIFIGSTASIIESLERGVDEIFHITIDSILDVHANEIWKNIDNIEVTQFVYKYKLNELGSYIKLSDINSLQILLND